MKRKDTNPLKNAMHFKTWHLTNLWIATIGDEPKMTCWKQFGLKKLPKTFLKVIFLALHRILSEKKICSRQVFKFCFGLDWILVWEYFTYIDALIPGHLKLVLEYESSHRSRETVPFLPEIAACVLICCYIEKRRRISGVHSSWMVSCQWRIHRLPERGTIGEVPVFIILVSVQKTNHSSGIQLSS